MFNWMKEHSLSLSLAALYLVCQTSGTVIGLFMTKQSGWELAQTAFQGHADDVLGAWLIVVFTKWFVERGKNPSKESK